MEGVGREFEAVDAWPTWVLSNHDQPRHRTRYGSEARARAAAVLLLGLRGTPFLYQGEELGLEDAVIPEQRRVDPGNRDGCRAPMPWDAKPRHGWPADPWLTRTFPVVSVPSPQSMVAEKVSLVPAGGKVNPGSLKEATFRFKGEWTVVDWASTGVTVGAMLATETAMVLWASKVPSSSVAVALIV